MTLCELFAILHNTAQNTKPIRNLVRMFNENFDCISDADVIAAIVGPTGEQQPALDAFDAMTKVLSDLYNEQVELVKKMSARRERIVAAMQAEEAMLN